MPNPYPAEKVPDDASLDEPTLPGLSRRLNIKCACGEPLEPTPRLIGHGTLRCPECGVVAYYADLLDERAEGQRILTSNSEKGCF